MTGDYDPLETAPAAAPPRRLWLRRALVPGIAFLLGLGVMGYLLSHWEAGARLLGIAAAVPEQPAPEPAPRAQPQPVVQYVPPPGDPAAPGSAAEQDFARRLGALEQRFGQIDSSSRVAVGGAERTEALVVAIAARRAIDRGVQLGFLENMLRQRFGAAQPRAVGAIIAAARQPVTLAQLQSELETLGTELTGAPPDQSWWGALRDELGSLIVVRSAETPSADPGQRLARAKRSLQAGEVAAAIAEVQRMPGRDHGADWVARARRYALAHQALDLIETAALLEPHAPPPAPARPAPAQARPAAAPARPAAQPARPPARAQPRAAPRPQTTRPAATPR